MGDKTFFVVAKIFDKQGCIAYRCKTPREAMWFTGDTGVCESRRRTNRCTRQPGHLRGVWRLISMSMI